MPHLWKEVWLSNSVVAVKLNAGRNVVGVLRGFDQFMNLVLDNTVEINGADKNDIGMVVSALTSTFYTRVTWCNILRVFRLITSVTYP